MLESKYRIIKKGKYFISQWQDINGYNNFYIIYPFYRRYESVERARWFINNYKEKVNKRIQKNYFPFIVEEIEE